MTAGYRLHNLWCVWSNARVRLRPAAPAVSDFSLGVGQNEGVGGWEDSSGRGSSAFVFTLNMGAIRQWRVIQYLIVPASVPGTRGRGSLSSLHICISVMVCVPVGHWWRMNAMDANDWTPRGDNKFGVRRGTPDFRVFGACCEVPYWSSACFVVGGLPRREECPRGVWNNGLGSTSLISVGRSYLFGTIWKGLEF